MFRAYDVRGVYGKDLTEEIMERIGRAAGTMVPGTFTVSKDIREHSSRLENAFVSGLLKTGSNAQLIGTWPVSLCVFANWKLGNDTSAYITASHLPAEWNGIKFFHKDGVGFFEGENKRLGEIHSQDKFKTGNGKATTKAGVENEYIEFVVERIKPKPIKVVMDFGNGAACLIVPKLVKRLGFEATFLFDWPDSTFPNRNPEPKPESLSALREEVVETKADLGVAYDSDGDRAVFVDDTGRVAMTEQIAVLLIREIMKDTKGPVVANVECSNLIEQETGKFGQPVFRIPVGHTFLVQQAKKHNAIIGIESSGHVTVPKFYWFDDAIINSMYLIEIASKMNLRLSEFLKTLPSQHFRKTEIKCRDDAKFEVMRIIEQKAKERFSDVNTIDGVKITLPDGWALIRASNTSPSIRLSVEAETSEALTKIEKQTFKLITGQSNSCN